jgi:hypothetical protein
VRLPPSLRLREDFDTICAVAGRKGPNAAGPQETSGAVCLRGQFASSLPTDHPIFRIGLRTLMSAEPGTRAGGRGPDGDHAHRARAARCVRMSAPRPAPARYERPGSPPTPGFADVRPVGAADGSHRTRPDANRAGARRWGVLLKQSATICCPVHSARSVVASTGLDGTASAIWSMHCAIRSGPTSTRGGLTGRAKREIVALIVTGASNKDIAWQLGLERANGQEPPAQDLRTSCMSPIASSSPLTAVERRLVAPAAATRATLAPRDDACRRGPADSPTSDRDLTRSSDDETRPDHRRRRIHRQPLWSTPCWPTAGA